MQANGWRVFFALITLTLLSCKTPGASTSETLGMESSDGTLTILGNIPARYLPGDDDCLGQVHINADKITGLKCGTEDIQRPFVALTFRFPSKDPDDYDFIYPGLVEMHNHNKQNHLPVWNMGEYQGIWNNRFEWRKVKWSSLRNFMPSTYADGVGGNMNPWSSPFGGNADKDATVATYRWTELQAMAHGAVINQGYTADTNDYNIRSVSEVSGAEETGDLVDPYSMRFFWNEVRPLLGEMELGAAVRQAVSQYCANVPENMMTDTPESCEPLTTTERDQKTRINAFLPMFKKAAGRLERTPRVFVTHLAEGRRDDPYNRIEYELIKLLGLAQDNLVIIHGVGIDGEGYKDMANRGIGLVWSPYSNLILYRQTADIKAAWNAVGDNGQRLTVALGSDWTPTGAKSVLEELKVAKAYAEIAETGLTDDDLYAMVTENPARLLKRSGEIGTLAIGAQASIIAVRRRFSDPETNLVNAHALDVNLVLSEGKILYGEPRYMRYNPQTDAQEIIELCGRQKVLVPEDKGDGHPDSYAEIRAALHEATYTKSKNSEDEALRQYLPPEDQFAQLVTCPGQEDEILARLSNPTALREYLSQTPEERAAARDRIGFSGSTNSNLGHNTAEEFGLD